MKVAWLTDPHLNFAGIQQAMRLMGEVRAMAAEALLVSGDIGEAPDLDGWLDLMAKQAGCPVYFVLGNHDFYHDRISEVRATAMVLSERYERLCWLGSGEVVALTPHTALIGHDGWGDARLGSAATSRVMLADFHAIEDFARLDKEALIEALRRRGEEAAEVLERALTEALARGFSQIKLLTHVPPFEEACWHEGNHSDEEWLPYFGCGAVGEMLRRVMASHERVQLHVLCGHTHSAGEAQITQNIRVTTGAAVYRRPALQPPIWCL